MASRGMLPVILSRVMREKLFEPRNVAKGDDWLKMPRDQLWMLLLTEIEELRVALDRGTREDAASEIADCANFLAMILDHVQSKKITGNCK